MLSYLLLGLALLIAVLLLARWFVNANPKSLVLAVKCIGGALLAFALLYIVLSGRFALIFWLVMLAPIALRMFRRFGNARPSPGLSSDVETAYLRMVLDHDSGEMTGTVLKGDFAGRDLGDLGLDELLDLFELCLGADEKSAQVLEAYLDRGRHANWRDAMDARQGRGVGKTAMTMDEARDILGVGPDANSDEIRAAHRELMKQNHPDRGGSTYLAAKINLAKDLLLGV
ncbi:MAG: DnaJ domain-containing protein [Alphaproteobacteria bacterium]|jgi:hypothetical protein